MLKIEEYKPGNPKKWKGYKFDVPDTDYSKIKVGYLKMKE